jgi:hypothetical protein
LYELLLLQFQDHLSYFANFSQYFFPHLMFCYQILFLDHLGDMLHQSFGA